MDFTDPNGGQNSTSELRRNHHSNSELSRNYHNVPLSSCVQSSNSHSANVYKSNLNSAPIRFPLSDVSNFANHKGLPFSSVNSSSVTTSNVTLRKPEIGNIHRPTINESRMCNSYCSSTPVSASNSQARMHQTSTTVTGVPFPSVNSSSVTTTNVTLRTPETENFCPPTINESDYSFSTPASAENSRIRKTTSTASRASILRNLKEGNVSGEKNQMRVPPVRLFVDDNSQVDYEFPETSMILELQSEEADLFWHDDNDIDDSECLIDEEQLPNHDSVPKGYASLGPPTEYCRKCNAIMWKKERANEQVKKGTPKKRNSFLRNIRLYNAIFSFTSIGGKVDHSINRGKTPYVYRLNGQNHHVFGYLIPNEGDDLKFCQLYIYDTKHEVENCMKWVQVDDGEAVDSEIVEGLISMLDETNQFVKKFRYARDRFKEQPIRDLKIKLKVSRSESGRENIIGPSDEVACVMVGDIDTTVGERDIIVEKKPNENERDIIMEKSEKKLERISSVHPSLMALQYPILLPFGEDGDGF
ncbi:hypothetical protein AgCh_018613 [Apium graveolens]